MSSAAPPQLQTVHNVKSGPGVASVAPLVQGPGRLHALAQAAKTASVSQRVHSQQQAADARVPQNGVVQRYDLKIFEQNEVTRFAKARATEWPGGVDAMVAWASSIKQVRTLVNNFTAAEWAEIQQLFPGGMDQSKADTIRTKVDQKKTEIYLATPLDGRQLKPHALGERKLLMPATELDNANARQALTAIAPGLANWGKYRTALYDSGIGDEKKDYSVHFYYNKVTKQVCTTRDYKKKFRDQSHEFI